MKLPALAFGVSLTVLVATPAVAWSPSGHAYVGQIADNLLNDNASEHVSEILGYDLRTAAKWADCVRSVKQLDDGDFEFTVDPHHPEYTKPCTAFMSSEDETDRMEDYAERNWDNCEHQKDHGCHESYHFADVDRKRSKYSRQYVGTNNHDVVSAINAAVAVLEGRPCPKPFSIKDEKEALLLLAHFVGDLHQPLHVSAIYLASNGHELDADKPGADIEKTETHGGNSIKDEESGNNLHSEWDALPSDLGTTPSDVVIIEARGITTKPLPPSKLALSWATDTIVAARDAWDGLTFSGSGPHKWTAHSNDWDDYEDRRDDLQKQQIIAAGAHLAALLNKIWP